MTAAVHDREGDGGAFRRVQEPHRIISREDINEFAATLGTQCGGVLRQAPFGGRVQIKSTLVLSKIAEKEELKVPEEKYREVVESIAKRNNRSVEELEKIISVNNSRGSIESDSGDGKRARILLRGTRKSNGPGPRPWTEFIKAE